MQNKKSISYGFLCRYLRLKKGDNLIPILKVIHLASKNEPSSENIYFSLYVSDGKNFAEAKASDKFQAMLDEGKISTGDVIRITKFQSLPIDEHREKNARLLDIQEAELVSLENLGRILPDEEQHPTPLFPIPEWNTFYEEKTKTMIVDVVGGNDDDNNNKEIKEPKKKKRKTKTVVDIPIRPIQDISDENGSDECAIVAKVLRCSLAHLPSRKRKGEKITKFEMDIQDSQEIRVIAWGSLAEKLAKEIKRGEVVRIEKFRVSPKNGQFNHLSHAFEIVLFEDSSMVTKVDSELFKDQSCPLPNVTPIQDLEAKSTDSKVNVIGIVLRVGAIDQFTSKKGNLVKKREILIADQSNSSIFVILFGDKTTIPDQWKVPGHVIGLENIHISRFGDKGTELSCQYSTYIIDDLKHEPLSKWYSEKSSDDLASLYCLTRNKKNPASGDGKTIPTIKINELGLNGDIPPPPKFIIQGVLGSIERDPDSKYSKCPTIPTGCWPSCPKCYCELQTDVSDDDPEKDVFVCHKCEGQHKPIIRYRFKIKIQDDESSVQLNCNDKISRLIMGKTTPEQLHSWLQEGKCELIEAAFQQAENKCFVVTVHSKVLENDSYRQLILDVTDIRPVQVE